MKQISILFLALFCISVLHAQVVITGTLKPGSASNSVMVVLKANNAGFTGTLSAINITLQVPSSVSPTPVSSIKSSPLGFGGAFALDSGTQTIGATSFRNFLYVNNNASGAINIPSGGEFNALEVEFRDAGGAPIPNISNQVRLAFLPNGDGGGSSTQFSFYVESGGNEMNNTAGPYFYGPTAVNDANGTAGYSFVTTGTTLPVSFLNFSAVRQASNVAVSWVVGSEDGVASYELEVSTNGSTFSRLAAKAPTAGSGTKSYDYTDQQVARYNAKQLYYRVKENGQNGKSSYSPVRTVRLDTKGQIALYPNPAKEGFTLNIPYLQADQKRIQLQLVNGAGQVLETKTITRQQAANYYYSLQPTIASGDYLLKIFEDGALTETKQLLIKR